MKTRTVLSIVLIAALCAMGNSGCDMQQSSDQVQQQQQESLLQEGTAETGMPAIKNFRERKLMKLILEERDQDNLITYTYLENMNPTVVKGHTALGGKLTYIGQTVGFPLPYATEYTSPQKFAQPYASAQYQVMAQADPNGLFAPADAEGTWILLKGPDGTVAPAYFEPRLSTFTYQLPFDE